MDVTNSQNNTQQNNPLHGITLEQILNELVEKKGWDAMWDYVNIRCFQNDPSIKSSLAFLRKTPWARERVEKMYINHIVRKQKK